MENSLQDSIKIKLQIKDTKIIGNRKFYDSSPFTELNNTEYVLSNDINKIFFCDIFNDGNFVRSRQVYQQFDVNEKSIKTRDFEILKRSIRNIIGTHRENYGQQSEAEFSFLCLSNLASIAEYEYFELLHFYKRKYLIDKKYNNNKDRKSVV